VAKRNERPDGEAVWLVEPLVTDRLRLRAFAEPDRPAVVRLHGDERVRRYLGGARPPAEVEAALAAHPMGACWGIFAVVDRSTDRVMGSVDLDRKRGDLEVSWVLLPEHWGAGFAFEAVTAVIAWVFEQTADQRIIAVTQAANTRSCTLAQRLGMSREATFEEYGAEQVQFVLARRDFSAPEPPRSPSACE
jgi:[ribosomal protein S5]-alanine N-acetyltransferase